MKGAVRMHSSRPPGSHRARRPRLLVASAAATLTTLAVFAGAGALPPSARAEDPVAVVGTGPDSRERAFAAAAAEFGVPQEVLEAVSYAQTRWDFRPGHSTSGGYGPMHLVDAALATHVQGRGDDADGASDAVDGRVAGLTPAADTLGRAAGLLGLERDALRTDELANIRGGAALLASTQRDLGLPVGAATDAGDWYAAVAAQAGSVQAEPAAAFADDTYTVLQAGAARTTVDGKEVSLLPQAVEPAREQLPLLGLRGRPEGPVDCPPGLDCEWVPAPYEDLGGGDYGNHDLADRPDSPEINGILVHNTEASYETTLRLVTDPTYLSWQYSLRSSDGHIAQHLEPKDVGWHAGNWYVNAHSIGLEHEGFAASGAQWFSEPMYRSSARLVRHLATKYDIPLDRQHVYGHDQVPGTLPTTVRGMHWDPGPYWDWEHYFQLLGAPLSSHETPGAVDLVRILPGFDGNVQPMVGCVAAGVPCTPQGTNFVYLRQAPSATAPLIKDVGLNATAPSTLRVSDIGAKASAGVEYAVADRQGDWTAIWFNGEKGWFHNPADDPTAIPVSGSYVVPKAGLAKAPVYGRAYPEAAAYPAGIPVQSVVPLQYTFAAGQRYAVGDLTIPTNYYRAVTFSPDTPNDHVDVVGQDRYYQISLGHRFAYVRAADVDVVTAK